MKNVENSCGCGDGFTVFPTYKDCVSCSKKIHCGFECPGHHDTQHCVQCIASQFVQIYGKEKHTIMYSKDTECYICGKGDIKSALKVVDNELLFKDDDIDLFKITDYWFQGVDAITIKYGDQYVGVNGGIICLTDEEYIWCAVSTGSPELHKCKWLLMSQCGQV
eukprot:307930_1